MRRLIVSLCLLSLAGPAVADTRLLAFDPADRVTRALTRGVTLEVERGLFGSVSVRRILSTSARGAADIDRGGPDEARRVLPQGSAEATVYTVALDGDGRGLARALCPGADQTFLVLGRVRAGQPMAMHGVGRWADGAYRHCVTLSYRYRGEWSAPPRAPAGQIP